MSRQHDQRRFGDDANAFAFAEFVNRFRRGLSSAGAALLGDVCRGADPRGAASVTTIGFREIPGEIGVTIAAPPAPTFGGSNSMV